MTFNSPSAKILQRACEAARSRGCATVVEIPAPSTELETLRADVADLSAKRTELHRLLAESVSREQAFRNSLRECVAALERMDARLLRLTDSPKEYELGEIVRARRLL